MSQGLEKGGEIIPNNALKKANEGHRKEAKVPDKLTLKTAELSKHVSKFTQCGAVQPCKKSHMIWSGDEQEKSNVPEC